MEILKPKGNACRNNQHKIKPDGSVYHLNLKTEHMPMTLFCGDQNRVEKITHFDSIEFRLKREFKTQTGIFKGKRITVMSTGIGPDNIDIVMNELDASKYKFRNSKPKENLSFKYYQNWNFRFSAS
jgi:uridine phosphorylase